MIYNITICLRCENYECIQSNDIIQKSFIRVVTHLIHLIDVRVDPVEVFGDSGVDGWSGTAIIVARA